MIGPQGVTSRRNAAGAWLRRALVGLAVVFVAVLATLAYLLFGGPRSHVLVRNSDPEDLVACTVRVESEFNFDQVRSLGRIAAGASALFQVRRLNESSFVVTCRYSDGRVLRGSGGNVWDPAPGDTTDIEVRRVGFIVRAPMANADSCAWSSSE